MRRTPTPHGVRAWEALTPWQQVMAADWAARHLNRHLHRYRRRVGRGVIRFAAGRRERRPDRRRPPEPLDEVVLTAFVKHKWTVAEGTAARAAEWIPQRIQLRVPVPADMGSSASPKRRPAPSGGPFATPPDAARAQRAPARRQTLALPVDVHLLGAPRSEAAAFDAQRLFALGNSGNHADSGVPCAHVRAPPRPTRYLLTCHHVAFRSDGHPHLTPDRGARIHAGVESSQGALQPNAQIGTPAGLSQLKPGLTNQLDAALVELNPAGIALVDGGRYLRVRPRAHVGSRSQWLKWHSTQRPKPTLELDPGGSRPVVRLEFDRIEANRMIHYAGGAQAWIVELFVFRCLNGPTHPGYSGSPITLRDGQGTLGLVAMHIAGDVVQGIPYSYAIPAYWILRKNVLVKEALVLA